MRSEKQKEKREKQSEQEKEQHRHKTKSYSFVLHLTSPLSTPISSHSPMRLVMVFFSISAGGDVVYPYSYTHLPLSANLFHRWEDEVQHEVKDTGSQDCTYTNSIQVYMNMPVERQ